MNASVSSTALRPAGADGVVKAGDAARAKVGGGLLAERSGVRLRREVDLQRRQHVDHQRALDDLHRARRVARCVRAERAVACRCSASASRRSRRSSRSRPAVRVGGSGDSEVLGMEGSLSSSLVDCRRAGARCSPAVTSGQNGGRTAESPLPGQNCVIKLNPIVRGCTRLTQTGPPSAENAVVADSLPRSSNAFFT